MSRRLASPIPEVPEPPLTVAQMEDRVASLVFDNKFRVNVHLRRADGHDYPIGPSYFVCSNGFDIAYSDPMLKGVIGL